MKMRTALLLMASLLLLLVQLATGSVSVPMPQLLEALLLKPEADATHCTILWDSRIPRTLAAMIAGASLSWSGMLMQTLFRNPLAGPSMLGVSSGASLGVALLVLGSGGALGLAGISGYVSISIAAFTGAFLLLALVLLVARRFADESTLLIFGIMLTFFTSAVVDALQSRAGSEALRSYITWGMGNFGDCNFTEIIFLLVALLAGLGLSIRFLPALNLMLLGETYAQTMGVDVRTVRISMMIATGILAGCVTAFCGPVAFIGLAVPHLSRWLTQTADHRNNLLTTLWLGAVTALFCDWLSRMTALPLNTIASALGAPFVIALVIRWKRFSPMI
ncbi:MAG: FecCD family ABC transporter permease [Flavobacteriales bacterium]